MIRQRAQAYPATYMGLFTAATPGGESRAAWDRQIRRSAPRSDKHFACEPVERRYRFAALQSKPSLGGRRLGTMSPLTYLGADHRSPVTSTTESTC